MERVSTGGTKTFEYSGGDLKLDEERKKAIAEGYEKYNERKVREKRNKLILWIIVAIILLIVISFFVLKS